MKKNNVHAERKRMHELNAKGKKNEIHRGEKENERKLKKNNERKNVCVYERDSRK